MDRELLLDLKERFKPLARDSAIWAILVFGSAAAGERAPRSDIDICVVAPEVQDKEKLLRKIWRVVNGNFDLWLFEELPLYLQMEVISEHIVLHSPQDAPALHEYFYFFRKLWRDQACVRLGDD